MTRTLIIATIVALSLAGSAHGYTTHPRLSEAATDGAVEIRCLTAAEMASSGGAAGANGYLSADTTGAYIAIAPHVCPHLLRTRHATFLAVAAWQTLSHEAAHYYCWLHPSICLTTNEQLVDCIGVHRRERIMRAAKLPARYLRGLLRIAKNRAQPPTYCDGYDVPRFP